MVHVMSCCAPQNQLQYGAFMVVCIRCQPGDLTKYNARQRAIKAALQHEDFSKEVWHIYKSPRITTIYTLLHDTFTSSAFT